MNNVQHTSMFIFVGYQNKFAIAIVNYMVLASLESEKMM